MQLVNDNDEELGIMSSMSSHLPSILSLGFSIDAIKCDATNYHDFKQHLGLPRKNKIELN